MFGFIKRIKSLFISSECICCKQRFPISEPNLVCPSCRILTRDCPDLLKLTPASFIVKFLSDESKIRNIESTLAVRDGKIRTYKQELESYVTLLAQRNDQIRGLEAEQRGLEQERTELKEEIRKHKEHDDTVRLPLLECLRQEKIALQANLGLLSQEKAELQATVENQKKTIQRLSSDVESSKAQVADRQRALQQHWDSFQNSLLEVKALKDEIERLNKDQLRLLSGAFTPEELQNLCHNFGEEDYKIFADGCAGYQMKLFGKCERDSLKEDLMHLKRILKVWDKAGEAILRAYSIQHKSIPDYTNNAKHGGSACELIVTMHDPKEPGHETHIVPVPNQQ